MFRRTEKESVNTVNSKAAGFFLVVGCIVAFVAVAIFKNDISNFFLDDEDGQDGQNVPRQDRIPGEDDDNDSKKRGWLTEYISPENNDMKICNKDECIPCSSPADCNGEEWEEYMDGNKCVPREQHRSHGGKRKCAGCDKHEKFCECKEETPIVNFKLGEENGYDEQGHPRYIKENSEPLCLDNINIDDKDEIGDKYCNDLTSIKNKFIDHNIFDVSSGDIYSQPDRIALNLKDQEIIRVRKPFDVGKPVSEFYDNDSPLEYGSYLYSTFEDTNNDFFNCTCVSSPPGPPKYRMEQELGNISNNIYCKNTSDLTDIEYNNPSPGELRINLSLDKDKVETIKETHSVEMRLDEILFDPDGGKLQINNGNEFKGFKEYFKCSDESKQLYQINESSPHVATCSTLYGGIQLPYKCMDRCDETNLIIPESIKIRDGETIDSFKTYLTDKEDEIYKGVPVSDYLQCKPEYHQMPNFELECLNIDSSPLFNIDAMCKKLDNCKDYYVENNQEYPIGAEKIKCGSSASPCSVVCPRTDFECGPDLGFCETPIYTGNPSEKLNYSTGNTIGIKEKYRCCEGNKLQEFYTKTKGLDFCASPLISLHDILDKLQSAPIISQEEVIINESNLVNVPDYIKNGSSIHTSTKSLPFCFRTCENENIRCDSDERKIENKPLPLNASPSNYDFKKQCCINKDYFETYNDKQNNKFEGDPDKIYENHYKNLLSSGSEYEPEDFYDGDSGEIKTQGICGAQYKYMGAGNRADDPSLHSMGLYGLQKFRVLNDLINNDSVPARDINTSEFDHICYHLRDDECEKQGEFCASPVNDPIPVEFNINKDNQLDGYKLVDLKFETAGNGHPQVSCIADTDGKGGGNIKIINEKHSCNVKRIAYKDSSDNTIEKNQFKNNKGKFVDCEAPIKIEKGDKKIKPENSIDTGNIYGKYTTCGDGYDKTNFSRIEETENNKMCPTNFIPINPKKDAKCEIKEKGDCNLDKSCFYDVEDNNCKPLPRAACKEIRPPGRVNSGIPGYQQIFTTGETKNPDVKMISAERCSTKEGYFGEDHYKSINYDNDYLIEPNVKNLINCNDYKMKFDLSDLKRDEEYKDFLRQGYNLTSDPLCQQGYILNTIDNDEFICSPCPSIENINHGILNKCKLRNESPLSSPNEITDYDIEKLDPVNVGERNICRNFYTYNSSTRTCDPIKCTIPENMTKGVVSGVDNSNSNTSEKILTQIRPKGEVNYKYSDEGELNNYGGYSFNVPFNQPKSGYYCSNDKYALRDKCFGIHSKEDLKNTPLSPKIFESSPCHNYIDYTSYYTNEADCLANNHIWFKENSPLGDATQGKGRCVDVNDYKNDSLIEILMDAGFDRSNPSIISEEYNDFLEKNKNKIKNDLVERLGYSGMSSSQEPLMESFTDGQEPLVEGFTDGQSMRCHQIDTRQCGCFEYVNLKLKSKSCGNGGKKMSSCNFEPYLTQLNKKIIEYNDIIPEQLIRYIDIINYSKTPDGIQTLYKEIEDKEQTIDTICSIYYREDPPFPGVGSKASTPEINIDDNNPDSSGRIDNPNTEGQGVPSGINPGTMDIRFASPEIIKLNQDLVNYMAKTYPDNLYHGKNYHYTANKLDNPSNSWSTKKQTINSNLFSSTSGSPVEIDLYGNIKDGITEFEDWFDSPQTCGWVADLSNTDNKKAKDVLARKCNRSFYIGLEYDQTSNDFKKKIENSIGGYDMLDEADDFYKENLFYFNVDESNYDALKINPHPPSPVNQGVKGDNLPSFCNAHVQENPNMVVCSYNKINKDKDNFDSQGEALQEIKNEYLGYIKQGANYASIEGRDISYGEQDQLYGNSVNNKLSMSDFKTNSNKMLSDGSSGSLGWDDSWRSDKSNDARIATANGMNANLIQDNSIQLDICGKGFTPMKFTMPDEEEVGKCIQQDCGLKYSLNHAYYSHPKYSKGDKMTLIQEINENKTLKKYTINGTQKPEGKTTWGEIMNESNSIPWPILKAQSYMECQVKNEEASNEEIMNFGQRDIYTEIQVDKDGNIVETEGAGPKKTRTSNLNIALPEHKSKSGTGGGRTMRYIPFNTNYTISDDSHSYKEGYNCDNYNFLIWNSWYEAINEVSGDDSDSSITKFADKVLGPNGSEYIKDGDMGIFTEFKKLNDYYNSVFTREAWGGVGGSNDGPISNAPGYEKFLGEIDGRDPIFRKNKLPDDWLFAGSDEGKTKELWKYAIMKLLPIFESKLFFIPPLGFCRNNPNSKDFNHIYWDDTNRTADMVKLPEDTGVDYIPWGKNGGTSGNTFETLFGNKLQELKSKNKNVVYEGALKIKNGDISIPPKTLKPFGGSGKITPNTPNTNIRKYYGSEGGSAYVLDRIAINEFDQLYNRYNLNPDGTIIDRGDKCGGKVNNTRSDWHNYDCDYATRNMTEEAKESFCKGTNGCSFTPGNNHINVNLNDNLDKLLGDSDWKLLSSDDNSAISGARNKPSYLNGPWTNSNIASNSVRSPAITSEPNTYITTSAGDFSNAGYSGNNPNLNIFNYKPGTRGYYDPFDLDLKNYKDNVLKSEQVYVPSLNVYNKHFKNKFGDYEDWVGKTCFGYSDPNNPELNESKEQSRRTTQLAKNIQPNMTAISMISEKNNPCWERLTGAYLSNAENSDNNICSVSSPILPGCGYDKPLISPKSLEMPGDWRNTPAGRLNPIRDGQGWLKSDSNFYQECTSDSIDECEKVKIEDEDGNNPFFYDYKTSPSAPSPKYKGLDIRNVTDNYKMGRKSIFNKWIANHSKQDQNQVQLCKYNGDCAPNSAGKRECRYLGIGDVVAGIPLTRGQGVTAGDHFWKIDDKGKNLESEMDYIPWTHLGELHGVDKFLNFKNPSLETPPPSMAAGADAGNKYKIGICPLPKGSNSGTNIWNAPFRANISDSILGLAGSKSDVTTGSGLGEKTIHQYFDRRTLYPTNWSDKDDQEKSFISDKDFLEKYGSWESQVMFDRDWPYRGRGIAFPGVSKTKMTNTNRACPKNNEYNFSVDYELGNTTTKSMKADVGKNSVCQSKKMEMMGREGDNAIKGSHAGCGFIFSGFAPDYEMSIYHRTWSTGSSGQAPIACKD